MTASGQERLLATLNLVLAQTLDPLTWVASMSVWGVASKTILFLTQYLSMRAIGQRRRQAGASPLTN